MTKKEAAQILAILKQAYPNSYKLTEEEAMGTISVWQIQFENISPQIVYMAVNKHIASSKFPPSICEIKENFTKIHWEAYDMLNNFSQGHITEADKEIYKRIYEETKRYKFEKCIEPSLKEMICSDKQLLIE